MGKVAQEAQGNAAVKTTAVSASVLTEENGDSYDGLVSEPILATKLHVPAPRRKAVPRPRLIEWLNEGLHQRLTLISAPAGFGKTTLVSEWIAGSRQPAAWLSLDEGDSDPMRFLAYLIAALRTLAANIGGGGIVRSPIPSITADGIDPDGPAQRDYGHPRNLHHRP